MKKVFSILVMVVILVTIASNCVLAKNPKNYKGTTAGSGVSAVESLGKNVIGVIQTVGSLASVIVLIVLGIKYMMGSTEEKAEYKKTLIPYIIGAVLIFAASNIAGFVFNWASTIS